MTCYINKYQLQIKEFLSTFVIQPYVAKAEQSGQIGSDFMELIWQQKSCV